MDKNMEYYKSIQNAHNTTSKKEYNLAKLNNQVNQHFTDSIDYEIVLKNNISQEMMIIKTTNNFVKKVNIRPQEEINMGDMIDWSNGKWLVTSLDLDNKTYKRAEITACTFLLRWQNSNGDILERWCVDEDATNASGLDENKVITTNNSRLNLQLPLDDDTKFLKIDKRFLNDVEGVETPNAYTLTDRNVTSQNYSHFNRGGILKFTLVKDLFKLNDVDNKTLMIADYITPSPTPEPNESGILLYSVITCSGNLNIGGSARTLTPTFYNSDNTVNTSVLAVWNCVYPVGFESYFTKTDVVETNKIKIGVANNYDLIGKKVEISVSNGNGEYIGNLTLEVGINI